LNDRRVLATRVREKATDAGRAFAFHFFLRYGDYTDVVTARECALSRQFFQNAASEALAGFRVVDDADRQLLQEYALAAVEVAFNERLQALTMENATRAGLSGEFRIEWSCDVEPLKSALARAAAS